VTLATNNLISLFCLHRRLRGALLRHLAAYEATSALPNRRYGNGLRRLGYDEGATGPRPVPPAPSNPPPHPSPQRLYRNHRRGGDPAAPDGRPSGYAPVGTPVTARGRRSLTEGGECTRRGRTPRLDPIGTGSRAAW
jgi:hypothetical protein